MVSISTAFTYLSLIFGLGLGCINFFNFGRFGIKQYLYEAPKSITYWVLFGVIFTLLSLPFGDVQLSDWNWLKTIGITDKFVLVKIIGIGYIVFFIIGRLFFKSQVNFDMNYGYRLYIDIVKHKGYWFSHRNDKDYFKDEETIGKLQKIKETYISVLNKIGLIGTKDVFNWQRVMVLHHKFALLNATLGDYDLALESIELGKGAMKLLDSNGYRWEKGERDAMIGQFCFVEGELQIVKENYQSAKKLFEQSKSIDETQGNTADALESEKRIKEIDNLLEK